MIYRSHSTHSEKSPKLRKHKKSGITPQPQRENLVIQVEWCGVIGKKRRTQHQAEEGASPAEMDYFSKNGRVCGIGCVGETHDYEIMRCNFCTYRICHVVFRGGLQSRV
jgi:hypothetical protein